MPTKTAKTTLTVLAARILARNVAAHGFDWVDGLPDCWQDCLSNTTDGCDSKRCICDASCNSDSYLKSAVTCAVSNCEADGWAIELAFLGPLDLYCAAVGEPIPDDTISSAYAATSATGQVPQLTTRKVEHSTKDRDDEHQTTKGGGHDMESTVTKTLTQTTTDDDGNTLQIVVPIVMGPSTISTGKPSTSTLQGKSTIMPSSTAASPSQAPATPAPAPTQAQQAPSSAANVEPTQKQSNSNGNGSPFDVQAGAGTWSFSGPLAGLAAIVGVLIRL